ncbi:cytochrome c oxidase subunit NDUFA4-like [Varroa jacobsoni]|uniref:Uncharacterized protein n=1 Tax=Varroa destructor TaxID=109461 RepID=A0A7M7JZH3_VARDE|nr:cytochrome c oxidase subunit NDUFA4-like [Varroa destructor]XP_022708571.1 cytochrome c oxidase subunit NDUFA4-like [Varroa jacobsoni]
MGNFKLNGLTISGMKQSPALIPLFVIVGAGTFGCMLYCIRLAIMNPDVSWNKKKNPEPWQEYENKQYKFWSSRDYSTLAPNERPKF